MHDSSMEQLWSTSQLAGGNVAYIEELYELFLTDPNSVSEQWRSYFNGLPRSESSALHDIPHSPIREQFLLISKNQRKGAASTQSQVSSGYDQKQLRIFQLINAFRFRGHQHAKLDPLGIMEREQVPDLDLRFHELSEADMDSVFQTATLREIFDVVQNTYCQSVGSEFMHIVDTAEKRWFQQRIESVRAKPEYSDEAKKHLLERLTAAEGLEKYLGSKYPGVKRFGLEGAETLIPLMDELIRNCNRYGSPWSFKRID